MKYLVLMLFLFIAYIVWPLELDETIAACITLAIIGALVSFSPLRNRSIL